MYGKQTETAIAAISKLAEVYDSGKTRLSASEIAKSRGLQGPFVAKMLTVLSQAGLVQGMPGPGGGYSLAKPPSRIKLYDVFTLFEREDNDPNCPFGGGTCGIGEACAVHDKLVAVQGAVNDLLKHTTFDEFRKLAVERGETVGTSGKKKPAKKRESFRAAVRGGR
ncbi:MAG: Rrf2 family transcriptional regulator [Planctomycetota bacterium]